jgi:hypothetical protein
MRPERLDPGWTRYPDTILVFGGSRRRAPLRVDLRVPIGARTRRAFIDLGLDQSFAVLTAYDPRGRDLNPAENRQRNETLAAELRRRGRRVFG